MPDCHSCGAFVTSRFARVFGDNDHEVYGCRQCLPVSDIVDGGLAKPDDEDTNRGRT
ncbi:DUF7563 family protein [Halosolutus halophilus]|uniref:DUF7563 family protein n=1 Tax=Halosolutus halophilus TaxID=1552990 RepID=UPI003CE48B28